MFGRRILFVASEAYPLEKTGGLADYVGGLTKALVRDGRDVRLLMPGYPGAIDRLEGPVERICLGEGFGVGPVALMQGFMPGTGAGAWLIDCPPLYARTGGIYQDAHGNDWPDNALRFGLLSRVAAWLALGRGAVEWRPDVVHLNEWQTGPAAALLAHEAAGAPPNLFTIHNMAFQGLFDPGVLGALGLPASTFDVQGLEFFGKVSYLKAGIRYADRVATVSRTYAREIMTPEFGCGLDAVLRQRKSDVIGILNGADCEEWDPATDTYIAAQFGAGDLAGKAACKSALRKQLGLDEPDPTGRNLPLLAYVSRLTHQKMADVLVEALPQIVARGAQVVVLGRGDHAIEAALVALAQRCPGALAVHIGYNEPLAHQVLAGADVLLSPARFEPCGLTQMYALRYGTVPVVTRVGGLRETVVDAVPDTVEHRTATGFAFDEPSLRGLLAAVDRALAAYAAPKFWRTLQRSGMQVDFSWAHSAREYQRVYDELVALRVGSSPG